MDSKILYRSLSLAGVSTTAWKNWTVSSAMNWAEIATAVCGNVKFRKQKKAAGWWFVEPF